MNRKNESPRLKRQVFQNAVGVTVALMVLSLLLRPQTLATAAPVLAITPITWNTLGLDENPNAGPDIFPVGARVCNSGNATAMNVAAVFHWDSPNALIKLSGSNTYNLASLPAGQCRDIYFFVALIPDIAVFDSTRAYHITVTASGVGSVSTPAGREIYVERLSPHAGLTTTGINGENDLTVGETYTYVVESSTAGDEYRQLVHFLDFPSSMFRLISASSTYTTPPGFTNDKIYADACGWDEDPGNPATYRNCTGNPLYLNDVVGGTLVTAYTVEVIAPGTAVLNNVLYGLSDGNFLYNSTYGMGSLTVTAVQPPIPPTPAGNYLPIILKGQETTATTTATPTTTSTPPTLTPTPTHTGTTTPRPGATKSISPAEARINQTVTFTIRVTNSGTAPAQNVTLTDNLSSYTYLDITNLVTTKGTVNINARTGIVTIGTLNPGEIVTVTLTVRVNNNAATTLNPCNTASITYTGGATFSSNRQCFRVLGSAVLPGTGQGPVPGENAFTGWPVYVYGFIFFAAGLLLVWLGRKATAYRDPKARFYYFGGLLLLIAGLLAGISAIRQSPGAQIEISSQVDVSPAAIGDISGPALSATPSAGVGAATPTIHPLALTPAYLFATPQAGEKQNVEAPQIIETLPVYPIPSPPVRGTPLAGDEEPDTSPIKRIWIPSINVDAVVAYVPFDGHTWLIQGLRDEVVWLGDTSWPGLGGNTGLAGHVTVRGMPQGGPFRYLADVKMGDSITLYTERSAYTYRVRERREVEETDLSVLEQTEQAQITLVTCVDWREEWEIYLKRLVVFADLVEVRPLAYSTGGEAGQ